MRVDLPAVVGGRSSGEARVVDASLVGCLLRSDVALDAGSVIDIEVELRVAFHLRRVTRL